MLFANRVSCQTMRANQVRLCLAKALDVAAEVFEACDESTAAEESARSRGRPRKPEAPDGLTATPSQREEMPPAQSKPRHRKTRKPTGG